MTDTSLESLQLAKTDALFLDLDGTLAEIGPDPEAIAIPSATVADLEALARVLDGAIVLLSGRDIRDLARRTPDFVWRAGGHGLEIVSPGGSVPAMPPAQPDTVLAPLLTVTEKIKGVWLETKGPVAALHYRAAPAAEAQCLAAAEAASRAVPGLVFQPGKMVVEVKPAHAHKGVALQDIAGRSGFTARRPVMIGDDTTDEDAMAVAQELGGIGAKVGPGNTVAQIRAADPAAVRAWLAREATRFTG
ncbi:MAG: trehalose-phosphatase [Rhodobacteraceae bacterium]|nr:trehalose-phosphatase [Paracoccaceae bacterium]